MLNVVALCGKIKALPEKNNYIPAANENRLMTIAVQRNFQNSEGDYDQDIFEVLLWRGISEEISERCRIGDVISLRGRIQSVDQKIMIIAEQVNLLPK